VCSARSNWPNPPPTPPNESAGSPSPWSGPGRPGWSWPGSSESSPPRRFLTGYRNRLGAILSWWPAFVRDIRRERTFTVHDTPVAFGVYSHTGEPGRPADTAT